MTTIAEARRIVELADKVSMLESRIADRKLSLKLATEDLDKAQAKLAELLGSSATPPFKVGDCVIRGTTAFTISHIWLQDGKWWLQSEYSGRNYPAEWFEKR